MPHAHIRCYAELNDCILPEHRGITFSFPLSGAISVGQVAARIALPTDEVDLVLVDGRSASLDFPVRDGDRISFYPAFESFDISSLTKIREKPLRTPRFVLDVHLGKLANHLRMLGIDTLYRNNLDDFELVRLSVGEKRTLLSKDLQLLRNEQVTRCYHVKEIDPLLQAIEVLKRFDLAKSVSPFMRCITCNTTLASISKQTIVDRLPPGVREGYDDFTHCPECDRIYWKGSHHTRMQEFVEELLEGNTATSTTHTIDKREALC